MARMCVGAALSVARLRWKSVPMMLSGARSRRSCASSSKPVASGTGGVSGLEHRDVRGFQIRPFGAGTGGKELLSPHGLVALAPAELGVARDLFPQPQDPVSQGPG